MFGIKNKKIKELETKLKQQNLRINLLSSSLKSLISAVEIIHKEMTNKANNEENITGK